MRRPSLGTVVSLTPTSPPAAGVGLGRPHPGASVQGEAGGSRAAGPPLPVLREGRAFRERRGQRRDQQNAVSRAGVEEEGRG